MSNHAFDWLRIGLLALAVIGVLASGQLVAIHLGQQVPDIVELACGGPKACQTVLASGYSMLTIFPPRPVPVAAIGLAYYLLLGIWLLIVGRLPGRLRQLWAIPGVIGLFGVLGSVFFIWVMAVKIQAWCGLCLAAHVVNFLLVPGIWLLWSRARLRVGPVEAVIAGEVVSSEPRAAGAWKVPVLALVTGLAVGLAVVRYVQAADADRALGRAYAKLDAAYVESFLGGKPLEIAIDETDPVRGPADAPHTVVVFSDFQCSGCATVARALEQIREQLPAAIRIVYKYFPLDSACNPARKETLHAYACQAAAAAEAARRLGGDEAFWKMHDLLFANQALLPKQPYRTLAQRIGLDPDEFEAVMQDPATMEAVAADAREGGRLAVRSTPGVFLDGKRMEHPVLTRGNRVAMPETLKTWRYLLLVLDYNRRKAAATAPATGPADAMPGAPAAPPAPLDGAPLPADELPVNLRP